MKKLKFKLDKKRGAVYGAVALMLTTAVYLNWDYTNDLSEVNNLESKNYGDVKLVDNISAETPQTVSVEDPFASAKLSKQQIRDEAMSILEETLNNIDLSDDVKAEAVSAMAVLSQNALSEGAIETMILAKGFEESVVLITETGVNILVSKGEDEFTAVDASVIKDIVITETGVSADRIKIVEGN